MTFRRWKRVVIALGAAVVVLAAAAVWLIGLVSAPHGTGYLSPVFAPDGVSILAIRRDVSALVTGFGWEFFTPPATVRVRRDRFELLSVRVADGQITVLETFPPSPLEGNQIRAYHGGIFGVAHAELRWADATHLDYEIAVTRHDSPLARTFVVRRAWNPKTGTYLHTTPWQETSSGMGGDEAHQIHGDLEAIAVPGDELLPCAIVVLRRDGSAAPLVETPICRRNYPGGISPAVVAPLSRRADIERDQTVRTTYAALVARGRAAGQNEGAAMIEAGREMQRLGLYPKTTKLVAESAGCEGAPPLVAISDEEFRYGLFPDIEAAIEKPGTEVDKSMGAYVTHRDYTTSKRINDYLNEGQSRFVVRAHGACWRMSVRRP